MTTTQTLNPIEAQQAIWDNEPPTKEELRAIKLMLEHGDDIAFIKKHYPSLLN